MNVFTLFHKTCKVSNWTQTQVLKDGGPGIKGRNGRISSHISVLSKQSRQIQKFQSFFEIMNDILK